MNPINTLINKMQPPNSITVSRVDPFTGQLLKPLVMLQPLPLGPYGFLEKLWVSYTMGGASESDAASTCMHYLDSKPVSYGSSSIADYHRYSLDDSVFKTRHIQKTDRHIIIPTDALQTRSMICLMYEGGLYQKATTGSFDTLRWFMLLPSSQSPCLYPVEIQLQPNGMIQASIRTQQVHDSGHWSIEFEDPSILAKYIETYTEHVVAALEQTRTPQYINANANGATLYTAVPRLTPDQFKQRFPWIPESHNDVNITANNVDPSLLDKLRKTLGI
jgi:hypothetical protein